MYVYIYILYIYNVYVGEAQMFGSYVSNKILVIIVPYWIRSYSWSNDQPQKLSPKNRTLNRQPTAIPKFTG